MQDKVAELRARALQAREPKADSSQISGKGADPVPAAEPAAVPGVNSLSVHDAAAIMSQCKASQLIFAVLESGQTSGKDAEPVSGG